MQRKFIHQSHSSKLKQQQKAAENAKLQAQQDAKRKADAEYAQTLKPYVKTEAGKFEVYEEPLETAPMAAAK